MSHPGAKRPSVPPQALRGASPAPESSEVVADIFNPFFYFFIRHKHEK